MVSDSWSPIISPEESHPDAWKWFSACCVLGIVVAYLFVLITLIYTDYEYSQVRLIAEDFELSLSQLAFLTTIYIYGLFWASNLISDGSELQLFIPACKGIIGSVILLVLGAIPDGVQGGIDAMKTTSFTYDEHNIGYFEQGNKETKYALVFFFMACLWFLVYLAKQWYDAQEEDGMDVEIDMITDKILGGQFTLNQMLDPFHKDAETETQGQLPKVPLLDKDFAEDPTKALKLCKAFFKKYDLNKDDSISPYEFYFLCKDMGIVNKEVQEQLFVDADLDTSGTIDCKEFTTAIIEYAMNGVGREGGPGIPDGKTMRKMYEKLPRCRQQRQPLPQRRCQQPLPQRRPGRACRASTQRPHITARSAQRARMSPEVQRAVAPARTKQSTTEEAAAIELLHRDVQKLHEEHAQRQVSPHCPAPPEEKDEELMMGKFSKAQVSRRPEKDAAFQEVLYATQVVKVLEASLNNEDSLDVCFYKTKVVAGRQYEITLCGQKSGSCLDVTVFQPFGVGEPTINMDSIKESSSVMSPRVPVDDSKSATDDIPNGGHAAIDDIPEPQRSFGAALHAAPWAPLAGSMIVALLSSHMV
jgi:hypothetical protein